MIYPVPIKLEITAPAIPMIHTNGIKRTPLINTPIARFFNTFFLNSKETIKFVTNGANVDKKPSKAIHCTTNVHNSKFSE